MEIETFLKQEQCYPSYYLGDGNKLIIEWVYPVRIVYTKNSYNNFKILSPFYVKQKQDNRSYKFDEALSSCKFVYIIFY